MQKAKVTRINGQRNTNTYEYAVTGTGGQGREGREADRKGLEFNSDTGAG